MNLSSQIAKHFRDIHFGGNWTTSNLRDHLTDVTWQQANIQIQDLNSIATLVFHSLYYVNVVKNVLLGGPLVGNDKLSFTPPPIQNQAEWEAYLQNAWSEIEQFAQLVEQLPEDKWFTDFSEQKYGNYYRNVHGIIEHSHYHLGQIVLIKKIIMKEV
jgi:hypothetical protein